jgi:hypothetical protein
LKVLGRSAHFMSPYGQRTTGHRSQKRGSLNASGGHLATNDERNAAHLLTLLEQVPGRQLSSAQLAEQTGWSPEELYAAVGLLRSRQQVVLDDAALGSGNYGFTSIMLP